MDYRFDERLTFSQGHRKASDTETIRSLLAGCESVRSATLQEESYGIDYIATLSGGAPVFIDVKARDSGARRWWHYSQPDLALETWSVRPSPGCPNGKIGWTLSQKSRTDMVLFTFDPSDTQLCYFVGFQPLRLAFERYQHQWAVKYQPKSQSSDGGRWESEAIFVPATVVLNAIREVSREILADQPSLPGFEAA